ncbi:MULTISPECIES: hypothetical protein [unclassified Myroides]|uniref:hypothetical protein n=1 Tax=unclassified Myroides TaxID=2642485 RepID=UPI003D2F68A3
MPRYFSMGGYVYGTNVKTEPFFGIVVFPTNLVLTPTNNKLEVKVRPRASNFNRNFGSTDGYFRRGMNVFYLSLGSTFAMQIFEK